MYACKETCMDLHIDIYPYIKIYIHVYIYTYVCIIIVTHTHATIDFGISIYRIVLIAIPFISLFRDA